MNKIDLILLLKYFNSKIEISELRIYTDVKEELKNNHIGQKKAYTDAYNLINSLLVDGGK